MSIQQGQQALASDFVSSTAGAVDAGKGVKTDANGLLDNSFLGLTGMIVPSMSRTFPTGWLLCNGQAVSRVAYAALFAVLCPSAGFTVTITSPAVFTSNNHDLVAGDRARLTTTGSLPTGLQINTDYYVISAGLTVNDFRVSTTRGGSAVNTSGSQLGTHSWQVFNSGVGDGSTTFNLPNLKGRTVFGYDVNDINFDTLDTPNMYIGEKFHQLTVAELAAHAHPMNAWRFTSGSDAQIGPSMYGVNQTSTGSTGGNIAHNNVPPYLVVNFIIRT